MLDKLGVIQHDQGREFEGAAAALGKKLGIKVVKGRPYHPQSQGKVEQAHRSFKKKDHARPPSSWERRV